LTFNIEIKRKALRKIESLHEKRKLEIRNAVIALKDDPVPYRKMDVAKLKGYQSAYRIRVGEIRIVYVVSWTERKIQVNYVGPRGKAYD
jgi:mRNA interferase RelE/StbE